MVEALREISGGGTESSDAQEQQGDHGASYSDGNGGDSRNGGSDSNGGAAPDMQAGVGVDENLAAAKQNAAAVLKVIARGEGDLSRAGNSDSSSSSSSSGSSTSNGCDSGHGGSEHGSREEVKAQNSTALAQTAKPFAPGGDTHKQVFISYNWAHQDVISRIAAAVKRAGFSVWLDVEQMRGHTIDAMAGVCGRV